MPQMTLKSEISQADLAAAFKFMEKRARRADGLEGMLSSLFAVMFVTGDCLSECGIPMGEVENVFEQAKQNVMFELRSKQSAHPSQQ